uniref:Uncharacterized protein n=1 Tax=Cannabis sativa TaxID=3483 RepID=A0A803P2P9_CANSA
MFSTFHLVWATEYDWIPKLGNNFPNEAVFSQPFDFFLESFGALVVKERAFLLYMLEVFFVDVEGMTDDLGVDPDHVLMRPRKNFLISPEASHK